MNRESPRPESTLRSSAREPEGRSIPLREALLDLNRPLHVGADGGLRPTQSDAFAPAIRPGALGCPRFVAAHSLRFPYVAGAMANGIGSVRIVEEMARHGMLGFFGAAGLPIARIERALGELTASLGDGAPFGFNLIHSPNEPALESGAVDLYLRRGVRLVEASAYLDLTLPLVRYRTHGLRRGSDGRIESPNRVIAKASRIEVATRFFSPPPEGLLAELVRRGDLTEEQSRLARAIPVAEDLTAEADSAGHTDNRPALTLLPTILALRDRMQERHGYHDELRVGAAGGIATPEAALAAFTMGAAYVLTGTVNQACVESGTSDLVRAMLAQAEQADVAMAPAADMFEMGVKVQVLKRGTLFAVRAAKLYELYRKYRSIEEIPADERAAHEKQIFRASLDEIWEGTRRFFSERDPAQVARAAEDPQHRLALVCRWYLGLSSAWANDGDESRKVDFQVWCGPAMGAFNEWTRGSFLERPENRRVATVAWNLLYGAAVLARASMLRAQGVRLPAGAARVGPRSMQELAPYFIE